MRHTQQLLLTWAVCCVARKQTRNLLQSGYTLTHMLVRSSTCQSCFRNGSDLFCIVGWVRRQCPVFKLRANPCGNVRRL
eukprot:9239478-Karenia_brevis.AAC.1